MLAGKAAIKEEKKAPFLKALTRTGKISDASRAVRISRDAVHDWRRNDPCFAAAFLVAKRQSKNKQLAYMLDATEFFFNVLKPFVTNGTMRLIEDAVRTAVCNKFKERSEPPTATPSRNRPPAVLRLVGGDAEAASKCGAVGGSNFASEMAMK